MSRPEPHEAVIGRRGWWVWNRPWSEAFGPRGRPERCDEVLTGDRLVPIERWDVDDADWRLTLLCWLQAIQTVAVVGGAYLFFRWARIACWLTSCSP